MNLQIQRSKLQYTLLLKNVSVTIVCDKTSSSFYSHLFVIVCHPCGKNKLKPTLELYVHFKLPLYKNQIVFEILSKLEMKQTLTKSNNAE